MITLCILTAFKGTKIDFLKATLIVLTLDSVIILFTLNT